MLKNLFLNFGFVSLLLLNGILKLSMHTHIAMQIIRIGEALPHNTSVTVQDGNSTCGHVTNVILQGTVAGPQGERGERGPPGPVGEDYNIMTTIIIVIRLHGYNIKV